MILFLHDLSRHYGQGMIGFNVTEREDIPCLQESVFKNILVMLNESQSIRASIDK